MNLYEFEGKQLLQEYNIPTPIGKLVYTAYALAPLPLPFVLKAQVLAGGRGKAGGIRLCSTQEEYAKNAAEILAMRIKGLPVQALLCEEVAQAEQEWYVSITLQGVSRPTLIISAAGGMDIEEVAKVTPEKILKMEIDPATGLKPYQLSYISKFMSCAELSNAMDDLLLRLQKAFFDTGAILFEINPVGVCNGRLIAMDSKIILDACVRKMQPTMARLAKEREQFAHFEPEEKEQTTITYVPLESGDIGLISDGAGTGMLTLDLVTDAGGEVASFCELGGTTPAEVMYRAMQYTLERCDRIKAVMIVLIGGFNRMDDMANGITGYLRDHQISVPIFTRMCGTLEEEGKRIMRDAGLKTYDDLTQTVTDLVAASKAV